MDPLHDCYALKLLLFFAATLVMNEACEVTNEYCFFNKPSKTLMPGDNEFGVYLTRLSECALLKRNAATYPIPVTGDPEVGEIKLPHTHRILYNEPYASQKATVYHVACPEGQLAYLKLLFMDFEPDSCSDYVEVEMSSGNVTLCGCDPTAITTPIVGDISRLMFRSDNRNRNNRTGFTAFLQCFNPLDANLEYCNNGSDPVLEMLMGRRKRSASEPPTSHLPQGEAKTVLESLSEAVFEVVATADHMTTPTANFSDQNIEAAICHMRSCNAILRATARAVLNHVNKTQPGRVEDIYRSKFTVPTPPSPTTNPPPTFGDTCLSTDAIPTCSQIGYSHAYFPNFRLLESLEDTRRELEDFKPLIATGCSNAISHLLCSVYAPMCYTDQQNHPVQVHPCVELCNYVRNGCESTLESFGMSWPEHLDCENAEIYKPSNSTDATYCPEDIEDLTIPPVVIDIDPDEEQTPRCESISTVPLCADIGYGTALFPNTRHETPSEANAGLQNLQPLIDSNCSAFLSHLLCSVNAPICYVDQSNTAIGLQTCSELCYAVKSACAPMLQEYNLQWPTYLECSNNIFRPNDSLTYCPRDLPEANPTVPTPTQETPTVSPVPEVTGPPVPPSPDMPQGTRKELYTCSDMTDIPICSPLSSLGWSSTSFPNFRNHKTHKEAEDELKDFQALINIGCSNSIVHFLCSVYAPFCDPDYPQIRLRPCKELCQHVRDDCEGNVLALEYEWPEYFDCNNATLFPPRSSEGINFCPDGIETLHLP